MVKVRSNDSLEAKVIREHYKHNIEEETVYLHLPWTPALLLSRNKQGRRWKLCLACSYSWVNQTREQQEVRNVVELNYLPLMRPPGWNYWIIKVGVSGTIPAVITVSSFPCLPVGLHLSCVWGLDSCHVLLYSPSALDQNFPWMVKQQQQRRQTKIHPFSVPARKN